MGQKCVITGSCGFVGRSLVRKLCKSGMEVIGIDLQRQNYRHPNYQFQKHDIGDVGKMRLLHNPKLVHSVFHLACHASPPKYQEDPIHTMLTNTWGTHCVLEMAQEAEARVVIASTSEVYGNPKVSPQTEEYWGNVNPIGIRSCYDVGKRAAECLAMDYERTLGTDVGIVRIFNTYGPGMRRDDGRAIPNFIVQALMGEPFSVYGDGTQTRSFMYIDDLLEGLIAMMESEELGPINLGNPDECVDMNVLLDKLADAMFPFGIPPRNRLPLPKDDPTHRLPDIKRAKTMLGWEPEVSLVDGLKKTIEYFREDLEKPHPIWRPGL